MSHHSPLYTFRSSHYWFTGKALEVYQDRLRYHRQTGLFTHSFDDIPLNSIDHIYLGEGFSRFFGIGDLQLRTNSLIPITISVQELKYAVVARDFIWSLKYSHEFDIDEAIQAAQQNRHRSLLIAACSFCLVFLMAGWGTVKAIVDTRSSPQSTIAIRPTNTPMYTAQQPTVAITEIFTEVVDVSTSTGTVAFAAAESTSVPVSRSLATGWVCGQRFSGSQWQYFSDYMVEQNFGLTWPQFGALLQQNNPHMFGERGGGKESGVFYGNEEYCLPHFISN